MNRSFLALCIAVCTFSCIAEKDFKIVETSHSKKPKWTNSTFLESKEYWYFIETTNNDVHSPMFAYKLARKKMHEFIKKDINVLLLPLKASVGKTTYVDETTKFYNMISTEIMNNIKDEQAVYYDVLLLKKEEKPVKKYKYTVAVRLSKNLFRSAEKKRLIRLKRIAELGNRKVLFKEVERIIKSLNDIRKQDFYKNQESPKELIPFS